MLAAQRSLILRQQNGRFWALGGRASAALPLLACAAASASMRPGARARSPHERKQPQPPAGLGRHLAGRGRRRGEEVQRHGLGVGLGPHQLYAPRPGNHACLQVRGGAAPSPLARCRMCAAGQAGRQGRCPADTQWWPRPSTAARAPTHLGAEREVDRTAAPRFLADLPLARVLPPLVHPVEAGRQPPPRRAHHGKHVRQLRVAAPGLQGVGGRIPIRSWGGAGLSCSGRLVSGTSAAP